MRHFRTFNQTFFKCSLTGEHFVFIAADLGRTVDRLNQSAVIFIYTECFVIVDVVNFDVAFRSVYMKMTADWFRRSTVLPRSAAMNTKCSPVSEHLKKV